MYGCKALPHMVFEKTFSLRAECVCCRQKSIPFQTSQQFATSMKVRLLKVGHSLRRSLSISHDLRFRENGSWVSIQFGLMKCASPHDVLPCCFFGVCSAWSFVAIGNVRRKESSIEFISFRATYAVLRPSREELQEEVQEVGDEW